MAAMEEIFGEYRTAVMVASGLFRGYKKSLPDALHPLFDTLEVYRNVLVMAYRGYEKSFDGSTILSTFEHLHTCLVVLADRADEVELRDFPTFSALQPPPLDRSLAMPEESEESSAEGQGNGGETSDTEAQNRCENAKETRVVTGDAKGDMCELTEGDESDVFLSHPTDQGGPSSEKYELPPLPNKRKASISSISEQPSRRTRVFDNELDYDG